MTCTLMCSYACPTCWIRRLNISTEMKTWDLKIHLKHEVSNTVQIIEDWQFMFKTKIRFISMKVQFTSLLGLQHGKCLFQFHNVYPSSHWSLQVRTVSPRSCDLQEIRFRLLGFGWSECCWLFNTCFRNDVQNRAQVFHLSELKT